MTTFLDEADQRGVIEAVRRAVDESDGRVTALWVTHRLEELEFADGAAYMEDGVVVKLGTGKDIREFIREQARPIRRRVARELMLYHTHPVAHLAPARAPHSSPRPRCRPPTTPPPRPPPFDAYAALGLDAAERASIDAARVKSAYRRMALATHPDKNDGDSRAFKRVAMAYKILGDAERRAAYDASGGVEGEDARDALETEIDISEVGFANTLVASVISSLGVNIKTAVPVKALEAVRRGETTGGVVDATVGCKLSESARKGEIRLFRCALSEEDVRRGVVVSATSPSRG